MRSTFDRVRHSLMYEVLTLLICTPLVSYAMNKPMAHVGFLSVFYSLITLFWNYGFNLAFDHALAWAGHPVHRRGVLLRVLHSLSFEGGLCLVTLPVTMWWLDLTLARAIAVEAGFLVFAPVFTYVYNWIYDRVFPMPAHG